jgi:hypothetical protein
MFGQVLNLKPIDTDGTEWPDGFPSFGLHLVKTKTTNATVGASGFLYCRACSVLGKWKAAVAKEHGPVFPIMTRCGDVYDAVIPPHPVNAVPKQCLSQISHDPVYLSPCDARAGNFTSALKAGIPSPKSWSRPFTGLPTLSLDISRMKSSVVAAL